MKKEEEEEEGEYERLGKREKREKWKNFFWKKGESKEQLLFMCQFHFKKYRKYFW